MCIMVNNTGRQITAIIFSNQPQKCDDDDDEIEMHPAFMSVRHSSSQRKRKSSRSKDVHFGHVNKRPTLFVALFG